MLVEMSQRGKESFEEHVDVLVKTTASSVQMER